MKNLASRSIVFLFALLVLGVLTVVKPAQADSPEPSMPKFEFSSTEMLALDPEKPTEFFILNKSMLDYGITLWISDLGMVDEDGIHIESGTAIEIINENLAVLKPSSTSNNKVTYQISLNKSETQRLFLRLKGDVLKHIKAGTYTGFLIAAGPENSKIVVQRALQITISAPVGTGTPLPEPLYAEWSIKAVRYWYRSKPICQEPCYLPLKVEKGKTISLNEENRLLGYLTGPNGELVQVNAATIDTSASFPEGVGLEFNNLNDSGTYSQTLDLQPADKDKGAVKLTVNVTDAWYLPVPILAAGIFLAIIIQRAIAVGYKIDGLRKRKNKLFQDYENNLKDSSAKEIGYSIDKDMKKRREALLKQLKEMNKVSAPNINDNDKDYKAVIAELDFIEAQLNIWAEFGKKWQEMKAALDKFAQSIPAEENFNYIIFDPNNPPFERPLWPNSIGKYPAFYNNAIDNLKSRELSLEGLITEADKVNKAKDLALCWKGFHDETMWYRMRVKYLYGACDPERMPKEYREDLYACDRLINQAWGDLWLAVDADNLRGRGTDAEIKQAEALLLGLHDYELHIPEQPVMAEAEQPESGQDETRGGGRPGGSSAEEEYSPDIRISIGHLASRFREFFTGIGQEIQIPSSIALDAKNDNLKRILREIFVGSVALFVAIITAMTTLYVDKNFGSQQDYLTAFAWGITSKALVEGIDFAAGRIRGSLKL